MQSERIPKNIVVLITVDSRSERVDRRRRDSSIGPAKGTLLSALDKAIRGP